MTQPKKSRRTWSAADKMRIVLAGMEPGVEISEVCRKEGVSPTQYYAWRNQLISSANAVFGGQGKKAQEGREAKLEGELARMKSVVAEITAENLELKKTL
jgi:transposase